MISEESFDRDEAKNVVVRGVCQVDFGNEMDILASLVRTLFEIDDKIYIFRNKIQENNMMWCKTPLLRLTKGEIYIPSEGILCIYPPLPLPTNIKCSSYLYIVNFQILRT